MSAAQTDFRISNDIQSRIDSLDWPALNDSLDQSGWAKTEALLSSEECEYLCGLYKHDDYFRSKIVMQRHRFGIGEYKYFKYPLPELVAGLRQSLYSRLVCVANEWMKKLGNETVFPAVHKQFISFCHAQGQLRPTPLLLRYQSG